MSFLAAPLDEETLRKARARHPAFEGELPPEAKFWSEADLDAFLGSGGQVLPRESGGPAAGDADGASCVLLSRLRLRLAEARVDQAAAEYRSLCRHLRERGGAGAGAAEGDGEGGEGDGGAPLDGHRLAQLPGAAECGEVPRQKSAPEVPRTPVVVERVRMWSGRRWNSAFWRRELGQAHWKCRARAPYFEGDAGLSDSLEDVCEIAEFVDYIRAVQRADPRCEEQHGLAFPRMTLDAWPAFAAGARPLFDASWRELAPPGVQDFSLRWLRRWSAMCGDMPHMEQLARFHRLSMSPAGGITRLHVENFGAHAWFTQIEGSRLFFLFPPQARPLYEESGHERDHETGQDYAQKVSPVDIFYPSQKRHPLFKEAKAKFAVLDPGQSLVVPSGWWHYSVALEASVTLHRAFWTVSNRGGIVDALRDLVSAENLEPSTRERVLKCLDELYEIVMDDDDPEDAELSD